ncbi:MAG: molybdopterin converting factor subunit 1 [Candidatus Sericytochromatia bacterium]|uniref:Molybdopterin synthase sulfur carrier subunit n=1 Tax=Candidatus Tanganyikabacteria bacterium TaxID=2961651 RepID=A0A937X327_9BACT|nr:molybdopterin converting factor subunit 1 [Candidatus Tanganyikabacteria bacterium]
MYVKLFAGLREAAGSDRITVQLPAGATVADLVAALGRDFPAIAPLLGSVRVAVNQGFADPATVLHEADEVAAIPPVSGG